MNPWSSLWNCVHKGSISSSISVRIFRVAAVYGLSQYYLKSICPWVSSKTKKKPPYYIDRSVLLKNTPLIKFIQNYIRDPSGVFSISSLVSILMTSFPALSQSFVQTVGEKWRVTDLSI